MAETEELPDEVKTFIVQELAAYKTPSAVAKAVKAEYELTVSRQRVHRYDPTKTNGSTLGAGLKALFAATRAALLEGKAEIAIAHKLVRLRWLNDMAVSTMAKGDVEMAAQLIEQAAKEAGDAFTNKLRHELTGANGGPIKTLTAILQEIDGTTRGVPAIAEEVAEPVKH